MLVVKKKKNPLLPLAGMAELQKPVTKLKQQIIDQCETTTFSCVISNAWIFIQEAFRI